MAMHLSRAAVERSSFYELLPIVLGASEVDRLFGEAAPSAGYRLTVDLDAQTVVTPSGTAYRFEIDAFRKYCLLNGLDEIGLTLKNADKIRAYEELRKVREPWIFA